MLCGLPCVQIRAEENEGVGGLFAQASEGSIRSTKSL